MKKIIIAIVVLLGILLAGLFLLNNRDIQVNKQVKQAQQKQTWKEILFEIGEWNVNNGETTTKKFQITSDEWRIKWGKRKLTQLRIEVFDANDKTFGSPFTADFGEVEGILNFVGKGTYYINFIGGTDKDAGVWDIKVEELL